MNKPVRVVFLPKADTEFKRLNGIVGIQLKNGKDNTDEIQLLKSIKQKIEFIKSNPFYGENIKKEQIPQELKIDFKIQNLHRVELSQFWRMLYTIKGDQIEVVCFVLDILDHPAYDKLFGYRKK
jgi:hypothetical protein